MSDKPKLTPTFNDQKSVTPSMVLPPEESKTATVVLGGNHIVPPHEPIPDEPWTPYDSEVPLNKKARAGDPMPESTVVPLKKRGRPKKSENKPSTDEPPAPCEALPEPLHPHLNGGPNVNPESLNPPLPKPTKKLNWIEASDLGPEGKVAILGTAPSSRMLAPFKDPSWKIWSCSPGNMNQIPRADVWFEIHSTLTWPENQGYGMPYLKWLSEQTIPVFMQDIEENKINVPNFVPFPADQLLREFGPFFFTSSFAWMMALAMVRGAKQIALFGVDMASRDEYILQRPGAYYFFMEAQRRGIMIGAPNESDIMQPPPPYGFFETSPFGRKICAREKELKDRITPMKAEVLKLQQNITYLEGALEDVDYVKNIWGGAQLFGTGPRMAVIPESK